MASISEFEHVLIRNYQDAEKYLVGGSIVMGVGARAPHHVAIVIHKEGHNLYCSYKDGIGQPLMLDGAPYKLPRGLTEEYVTLYTPQENND